MVGRIEASVDVAQNLVISTVTAVGSIATILTKAVADVVGEVGGLATEVFEMLDASRKAIEDGRDQR